MKTSKKVLRIVLTVLVTAQPFNRPVISSPLQAEIMLAGGIVCSFQSLDIYFVTNNALI